MANIPGPGLPDVAPEAMPTPYGSTAGVTPDAFGAAAGRSLERVGGVAHDLYQQEKAYADTAAVLGAEAQAKTALNSIILDDQKGYRSLNGIDAVAGRDDALQKFNRAVQDAGSTLKNDAQRLHFQQLAKTIQEEGFRYALHHETTEQERYAVAQFRGNVDQTMVTMENPAIVSDPAAIRSQIDSLFQTGIKEAQRRYGQNASKEAISSVVLPELQKAALGTMEAAVATQDPAVAKAAFDQVGRYMITNHQRFYANAVQAMDAKQTVAAQTSRIMATSSDSVPVPGGQPVARVDSARVAAELAALPPETPHLAETMKAVDAQEKIRNDLWSKSAAKVYERVHSAGQDPVTGDFDLQSPQISGADKAWLRQYAPGELDKLRAIDKRSTTGPAARVASLEALSQLSADMHDPQTWASTYSKMTSGQFLKLITSPQFDDLAGPERLRAQRLFDANKAAENKLEEPIGKTVKTQIAEAFPEDPYARKAFESRYFESLRAAAQNFQNSEKAAGRKVDTEAIGKFIDSQLAKQPSGHWYAPDKRLIEINAAAALQPPSVTASTPVAAPKQITGYRYNKDRTQRIPVYGDGTQGPAEPVQ